jgi:hypothetical protein
MGEEEQVQQQEKCRLNKSSRAAEYNGNFRHCFLTTFLHLPWRLFGNVDSKTIVETGKLSAAAAKTFNRFHCLFGRAHVEAAFFTRLQQFCG